MSNKLRAAFEGEGVDTLRHLKRIARLKNEWPELFDAIEECAYTNDARLDMRSIADAVLQRAEQLNNPLIEVPRVRSIGDVTFDYSDGGLPIKVVENYLDNAIRSWRRISANADHKHFDIAPYYVDAFQSARLSLLGETLPLDTEDDT